MSIRGEQWRRMASKNDGDSMAGGLPSTGYQQLAQSRATRAARTPIHCEIVNADATNDLLTMREKDRSRRKSP
jgi:hypothetical protein